MNIKIAQGVFQEDKEAQQFLWSFSACYSQKKPVRVCEDERAPPSCKYNHVHYITSVKVSNSSQTVKLRQSTTE